MNVYHEEKGIVFRKLEAETGISYISVCLDDPSLTSLHGLLVRHGNPFTGECGYYPLSLLLSSENKRVEIAEKIGKRPPSEFWVNRMLEELKDYLPNKDVTFH